jgi:predicted phosphodiesterase
MPLPTITVPLRGRGRPRTQAPKIVSTVVFSDVHVPETDWPSYHAMRHFIKDIQPQYIIINGDLLDCQESSRFDKDPKRFGQTEEELLLANRILDELAEASPHSIIKFIAGNHCYRLTKRLWENPDLLSYMSPTRNANEIIPRALSLDERGIEWFGYPEVYNHRGFLFTHGQAVGQHPASKELSKYGMSGSSGHIHKFRYWERRDRRGHIAWWSLGGLMSLQMDYMPSPDWQNGFGLLMQVADTDIFNFTPIQINGGKFIYENALYTPDGKFTAE